MQDHVIKSLKNGHYDPLRSAYALSDAESRDARFLLDDQAEHRQTGLVRKSHKLFALDVKES